MAMVPTFSPLDLNPACFVWPCRSTTSDVMATTTTATVHSIGRASLQRALLSEPSGTQTLPLPNARRSRVLLMERKRFMDRLQRERVMRSQLENWAASKLQAVARGFLARPKPILVPKAKERTTEESLKQQLARMAEETEAQLLREDMLRQDHDVPEWRRKAQRRAVGKKNKRRLKELEKTAAVFFQALIRGFLIRKAMRIIGGRARDAVERAAAASIQKAWRQYSARSFLERKKRKRLYDASVRIQAPARGMLDRSFVVYVRDRIREATERCFAATKMQSVYRARLGKKRVGAKKSTEASVKLQTRFRGHAARKKTKQKRRQRNEAATKLQSSFRGHKGRKRALSKRAEDGAAHEAPSDASEDSCDDAAFNTAATSSYDEAERARAAMKIQTTARKRRAKRVVADRRTACAAAEAIAAEEGERVRAAASVKVQSMYRQRAARDQAAVKREQRASEAQKSEREKEARAAERRAATRIQATQRGKMGRKEVELQRQSMRGQLEKQAAEQRRKSVKRNRKG